jgi:exonuclease III
MRPPGQLRKQYIDILSQNLRGFSYEKEEEFIQRIKAERVWAACVQETWRVGSERWQNQGITFLHRGLATRRPGRRAVQGVAIVLSAAARDAWISAGSKVCFFGKRIIATSLQIVDPAGRPFLIYLVSAYAPDSSKPQRDHDEYEENLECCVASCPKTAVLIIGSDANASIGVRSRHDQQKDDRVCGPFGIDKTNAAGQRLRGFMGRHELCATTTFFRRSPRGRHTTTHDTWINPRNKNPHQIDHFIIRQKDLKRVRNAGACSWGMESDHRAILMKLEVVRSIPRSRAPREVRVDRSRLRDEECCASFQAAVTIQVEKLRAEEPNLSQLAVLEKAMTSAAEEVLATEGRRRKGWFAARWARLKEVCEQRNAAQQRHNRERSDETAEAARRARKQVRREVEQAKKIWLDELVAWIEGRQANGAPVYPKMVWSTVNEIREGPRKARTLENKTVRADQSSSGDAATLCGTQEENRAVWTEELKRTFSKVGIHDPSEVAKVPLRNKQDWMDRPPNDAEVNKAVRKLSSGKSGGDAECPIEYYKALEGSNETKAYIRAIIDEYWKSGSMPEGDLADGPAARREMTLEMAKRGDWRISYEQVNPKSGASQLRFESYKRSTSFKEARTNGARSRDFAWDFKRGFLRLHDPNFEPRDEPGPLSDDSEGMTYDEWDRARLKLLPKKGDLSLCKNWRGICLLDVASKIFSSILVARMQQVMELHGLEEQTGFRPQRGTIDGLFAASVGLQKRKEHGKESWVLFLDLIKAFDSVPHDAVFEVLRRFGMPDHFINLVIRLHAQAKVLVEIDGEDSEVAVTIGVRQGSCEGPVLFLFIMQAAMETFEWPEGMIKPEYRTREDGKTMGECSSRKRGASSFHFWASLFADDCALIFETREDLIAGTDAIYAHLRKFGLNMHVGRGDMASKTEAMFFPKARQSYEDGDTSRFRVDGSGFVEFTESFKYLGSIIHYSLSADADVDKRIKSASAAFGALRSIFSNRHIDYHIKGRVYVALCLSLLLYGCEVWCLKEKQLCRLRSFHNRCARTMCRITMAHTIRRRVRSRDLFARLGIQSLDRYYHHRTLRWAGHVARMPMSRLPRKMLTGFVAHPRPIGCPDMTWGRSLKKALKSNDLPTDFGSWTAIAKDRMKWRAAVHAKDTHTSNSL